MFDFGGVLLDPVPDEVPAWTTPEIDPVLASEDVGPDSDVWGGTPVDTTTMGVTELLAFAQDVPVSTEAVLLLEAVDPASMDRGDRLLLVALCDRLESRIGALKLTAIAAYAGPEPDPDSPDGIGERRGLPDFVDCDIAAACRTSSVGGQRQVALARALASRLPGTLALLRDGQISRGHIHAITDLTGSLTVEQCQRVEQLVLRRAPHQSPGQFRAAVRRAVARIDADALRKKEKAARADAYVRSWHDSDGTGTLDARGPSVDISLIEQWVESYARTAKAAGDERSLANLRFAGLTAACEAALAGHTVSPTGTAPTEHGRPVTINLTIDLPTWLGLTDHPGEILGTDAIIPADVIRDLLTAGDVQLRRLITDPLTGELLDYGRSTYRVPADLAAFTTFRDVTSTAPGSTVPAGRGDKDHVQAYHDGGSTDRDNIHSPNRRWHRAKTLGNWTVKQNSDHTWTWTSPSGLTATTHPHDYRLGP